MDTFHFQVSQPTDQGGQTPAGQMLLSFRLDRIQRFAAGLRPIRLHGMERMRGMAWSTLRMMMEEESARPVSAEELDEAIRLFARLEIYEVRRKARDWLMVALFAAGIITGGWLLSRGTVLAGYITVLATLPVILVLRLCIEEWQLYRLRRPWGFGRGVLLFALKEIMADPRWKAGAG